MVGDILSKASRLIGSASMDRAGVGATTAFVTGT